MLLTFNFKQMGRISIINISDIHFERNEPENQGLIINAFFKDLDISLSKSDFETTYCIISGDLVNKGATDQIYDDFYNRFICRLSKYIPLTHIYSVPGNHDLNRTTIENKFDEYQNIQTKQYTEIEFNDFVKSDDNLLLRKFSPYKKFCTEKLSMPNFNLYGFSEILIPEISLFFLNSSLCSFGGYNKINDESLLKVETSELNKWIQENSGRKKVLVMHHPTEYLTTYAQQELKFMLKNEIDIIITGHTHNQEIYDNYVTEQLGYIRCSSPQLFSDKTDLNGYSIFHFEGSDLLDVTYRQWSQRQRKFMSGQDFSGTDNGVREFVILKNSHIDVLQQKLLRDFQKAMKSYSKTPDWVERYLSTNLPNSLSKEKEEKFDYLHIINTPKNYQIIAAKQFGLTCYARYLSLKAWEVKAENWLYFDSDNWRLSKVDSDIEDMLIDYNIKKEDVRCILLDNWSNLLKESGKIFGKLKMNFPNAPLIILSNYNDTIIVEGLDTMESHEGFTSLYLKELDRCGLRKIVQNFNDSQQIADENQVLERLNLDLIDLNIHRTPLNCLQLLLAFISNFEDRPINRSKIFDYLLKLIFDNPGDLFYGNTLDEKNCRFILGYFCEYLLRQEKEVFTEAEFLSQSSSFSQANYNSSNISDLLQILKNNQIVIEYNGLLRFRFSYWIYYFAAERMKLSSEFADYMFNQRHSIYYPEIIEFYTGTDGAREDAVALIIKDLQDLSFKVHAGIGLREDFNPFLYIKWALNETTQGMTQEQLEVSVRDSKLPDDIKDAVADKDYNSIKPYSQTISDFFDEYYVKNLFDLTTSASRALRNSEFITPESKEALAKAIFKSWEEIVRVLLLIAPILAKNGFGGVGGARFKLSEDFPKEYGECLKKVVVMMPFNIMNWYKDDIFSDKLILLLKKFLLDYDNPTVRHIIALLICAGRPRNFQEIISAYIGSVAKNSYYLGDLYTNLRNNYSTKFMLSSELKQTENLIKSCWVKHKTGSPLPGKNTISRAPYDTLPNRNLKDLE